MKAQMHKALSLIKTMPCFVFFVGIQLYGLVVFGLELLGNPIEKLLAISFSLKGLVDIKMIELTALARVMPCLIPQATKTNELIVQKNSNAIVVVGKHGF